MSRDRLLPSYFSKVHPKFKTPHISTWVAGLAVGLPAGVWDVGTFADLSNIGTLFAFAVVSAGVIVARKRDPGRRRGFRVPLVPLLPGLSIAFCLLLMLGLPLKTWLLFFVWLVVGLILYFSFGRRNVNAAVQADPVS
jgi:APA family basic amino acid/polyamine antiporter